MLPSSSSTTGSNPAEPQGIASHVPCHLELPLTTLLDKKMTELTDEELRQRIIKFQHWHNRPNNEKEEETTAPDTSAASTPS